MTISYLTQIVQRDKLQDAVRELPISIATAILFGGDRLSCIEWGVIAKNANGKVIGVTSVAPKGEMNEGTPTLVGVYVLPEYRRQGIATTMVKVVISRAYQQKIDQIRVDLITNSGVRLFEHVKDPILNIHDMNTGMELD